MALAAAALAAFGGIGLYAQSAGAGTITGTVTDPAGNSSGGRGCFEQGWDGERRAV